MVATIDGHFTVTQVTDQTTIVRFISTKGDPRILFEQFSIPSGYSTNFSPGLKSLYLLKSQLENQQCQMFYDVQIDVGLPKVAADIRKYISSTRLL